MSRFTNRIPFARNMQQINLEDTNDERIGEDNFYPSVLDSSAARLARRLVELAKSGEDLSNLTPNQVFGKKSINESNKKID